MLKVGFFRLPYIYFYILWNTIRCVIFKAHTAWRSWISFVINANVFHFDDAVCTKVLDVNSVFCFLHFKINFKGIWTRCGSTLTLFLCFVDRASRYMRVMKPTWSTVYLQVFSHYSSICFGLASSPSSGSNNVYMWQLVRVGRLSWLSAGLVEVGLNQAKSTTRTICYIYTLLPPDDGQLASPEHVGIVTE
jgi:hypothetical protein